MILPEFAQLHHNDDFVYLFLPLCLFGQQLNGLSIAIYADISILHNASDNFFMSSVIKAIYVVFINLISKYLFSNPIF